MNFFNFDDLWSENFCSEVKSDDILAIENFKRNRKPFFRFFVAIIVSEIMTGFCRYVTIFENLTLFDLW